MSPAAVSVPLFTNKNTVASTPGAASNLGQNSHVNSGDGDWNSMDNALDFDLLAEYLLEDGGMGGLDFM